MKINIDIDDEYDTMQSNERDDKQPDGYGGSLNVI